MYLIFRKKHTRVSILIEPFYLNTRFTNIKTLLTQYSESYPLAKLSTFEGRYYTESVPKTE